MREQIDIQTPCTWEVTIKKTLAFAGWPSSPNTTVDSHLFTHGSPPVLSTNPNVSLLSKPDNWVPGQEERGGVSHAKT